MIVRITCTCMANDAVESIRMVTFKNFLFEIEFSIEILNENEVIIS